MTDEQQNLLEQAHEATGGAMVAADEVGPNVSEPIPEQEFLDEVPDLGDAPDQGEALGGSVLAPGETTLSERQFVLAQRQAKCLAASTLIPRDYQNNIPNVMIALNMATRLGCDPLMVMQSLHIIHGRPSWSASFMISAFNSCGRYTSVRYEESGDACTAVSIEKATGLEVRGTTVTMEMAKKEGWVSKAGSKWKTMPQQMLRYRAATFMIRSTAPELLLGMHTADEVEDFS